MSQPGYTAQRGGQAWGQWQAWQQCRLVGVIEIRLARPDTACRPVVIIELMVPAAVLQIDEMLRNELPESAIPILVNRFACAPEQGRSRRNRFGMHPMQARTHHRLARPVEGIDQAWLAVRTPGVSAGTGEQPAGIGQQPRRRSEAGALQGSFQMQQQPSPLEAMPGRAAIGAKRVSAVAFAIVGPRSPRLIEMLDHYVPARCSMSVNQALGDAQRAQ